MSALANTEYEDPGLSLISASAIALGEQGSLEDKACKGRTELNFLPRTAGDRSTHGGLLRLGDFIVIPFPPPLPAKDLLKTKNMVLRPRVEKKQLQLSPRTKASPRQG